LHPVVLTGHRPILQAAPAKLPPWACLARRSLQAIPSSRFLCAFPPLPIQQRWAAERAADIRAVRCVPSEGNPGAAPHHLAGSSKSSQRGEPIESRIPGL